MSKLWQLALGAGLLVVLAGVAPFTVTAQPAKAKDLDWKHGMSLRVRPHGVADFTKDTPRFGLEAFADDNSGHLVYISDVGAVGANKTASKGDGSKPPTWLWAMDLSVRKAGEAKFGKDTRRCGVEVFLDENSDTLIYICENGNIATVPAGTSTTAPAKAKEPSWKHGYELSVRRAGEKDFNKDTKKWGVEVFSDENNGNLVYISETGSIAVVSGVKPYEAKETKDPNWKHGFEVAARKAGEGAFSDTTKRYNVEVFQDENNGNVIYISDTGALAVLPNVKVAGVAKVMPPEWQYASDLAVRKAGEDKFSKETKKYGVEFFRDVNDGLLLAISELGNIAIIPGK